MPLPFAAPTRIPIPTDGTDFPHAVISTVTSLRCLAESFDAVMDSLQTSIDREAERLDRIADRAETCGEAFSIQRHRRVKSDKAAAAVAVAVAVAVASEESVEGKGADDDGGGGGGDKGGGGGGGTTKPIIVRLPGDYARAIAGNAAVAAASAAEAAVVGRGNGCDDESATAVAAVAAAAAPLSQCHSSSSSHRHVASSAIAAARDASDEAVRKVLRRDLEADDGDARVSDLWLDRPRAFDVGAACRDALRTHAVPSLRHQLPLPNGLDYYKDAIEGGSGTMGGNGLSSSAAAVGTTSSSGGLASSGNINGNSNEAGSSESHSQEWDGAASVRTGISLSTRATTNAAAGATASDRRRQRQLQSLARKRLAASSGGKMMSGSGAIGEDADTAAAAAAVAAATMSTASSRQQAMSGSQPYLCEILHDAYSVGDIPPDGEAGTVFPAPRTVAELTVFQTGKLAYGGSAGGQGHRLAAAPKDTVQAAKPKVLPAEETKK